MKNKKIGMFGGKFLPLHSGHILTILSSARYCDILHVFLFFDIKEEEDKVKKSVFPQYLLLPKIRESVLKNEFKNYENIKIHFVDCQKCFKKYKEKTLWDSESTAVKDMIGAEPNFVFSSEPSYDENFKKSYPNTKHILIDKERTNINISGTKIREKGAMVYWDYLPKTYQILCAKMVILINNNNKLIKSLLKDLSKIFNTTMIDYIDMKNEKELNSEILNARCSANKIFFIGTNTDFFSKNENLFYKDSLIFNFENKIYKCNKDKYMNIIDLENENNFETLIKNINLFKQN